MVRFVVATPTGLAVLAVMLLLAALLPGPLKTAAVLGAVVVLVRLFERREHGRR